ncbi:MAG TPA: YlxR family protein [Longilinea sp.]|nr:YlxR family protein [Longilinea sp.]
MTKNTVKHVKHVPQRTCVGCRQTLAKRTLTRIVRTPEGVQIDPTGKAAGRGAYIHNVRSCWERAIRGALANALKTTINETDIAALRSFCESLSDEDLSEESA